MEARPGDAGARVNRRFDRRRRRPRREERVAQVRAAVRHISRHRGDGCGGGRRLARQLVSPVLSMTPAGQAFLGLTAIVTVLVAVLTFALLKFLAAARG